MANLTLRTTATATDPGSTTVKNSALTHGEMDSNFILLNNELANVSLGVLPANSVSPTELQDTGDFTMNSLTTTGTITTTGAILPSSNNSIDLGSPTKMWRDVYVGPGSLYVNGVQMISSDVSAINLNTTAASNQEIYIAPDGNLKLESAQGNVQITSSNRLEVNEITGPSGGAIGNDINAVSFTAGVGASLTAGKLAKPSGNFEIETALGSGEYVHIETNDLYVGNFASALKISDSTISSATASGAITIAPDSGADTKIRSNVVQIGQTNTDVRLTTNGTGDLTINTNDGTDTGEIVIRDGANNNIEITPNGTGELDIASNIKQPNGKIIEQYGGQTGLFIHDQSEGGYTTSSFSTPGGMLAGPGIHIDSAGQFQFPSLVLRNNSVSGYPYIWAAKARPTDPGGGDPLDYSTDAYMENDEILFRFYGAPFKADATSGEEYFTAGAYGDFRASENHSNGNLGCKIEFGTIDNGSTSPTTKMTIDDKIECNSQFVLRSLASDPSGATNGEMYYNTTSHKFRGYANGAWTDLH